MEREPEEDGEPSGHEAGLILCQEKGKGRRLVEEL